MSRSGVVDWLWCRSREFLFEGGGVRAPLRSAPLPGTRTTSRDLHQSRGSHQFPGSPPVSRLAEVLGPPPAFGSPPVPGIPTSSRDPHRLPGSAPVSRLAPTLEIHTNSRDPHRFGRFRGGADHENCCSGGLSVCRHAPSCRWYTPPLGTSPRSPAPRKPQYIKATKSGRSPGFVRDPLRDSATHGLTELPYGSQQLQPL